MGLLARLFGLDDLPEDREVPGSLRAALRTREVSDSPFHIVKRHQSLLPVDVTAIAHELGYDVIEYSLGENSGILSRSGRRPKMILNADHSVERRRFTVAHLIAMHILYRDLIGDEVVINDDYRNLQLESYASTQINRFAVDIVAPLRKVAECVRDGLSIEEMAKRFAMSRMAMRIRAGSTEKREIELA